MFYDFRRDAVHRVSVHTRFLLSFEKLYKTKLNVILCMLIIILTIIL